ncbi:hypothetical protein HK097_005199 [Rhizophlyctis rosea]|uniref:NmrA-like domain-containing protein n=1 Tax=Rhizophlyctis rosea TaxID=64517 RepID=A0AAD5SF78_9FUNG|nr:hypothetical protein HK097_005199 [Rhizophlyctis rosea]
MTVTTPKVIAVLGGTGTTGSSVLRALVAAKDSTHPDITIRALVRNPEKARATISSTVELVPITDGLDLASITNALKGVDSLYTMTPPVVETQIQNDSITALAAFQAGVKHVVYLSSLAADPTSTASGILRGHGVAENIYKHYKYPLTILRASWFMDNFFTQTTGLYQTLQNYPVPYVSAKDIGIAAATVLLEGFNRHGGKTYELYDPQPLSYQEIGAKLSKAIGQEVPVADIPNEHLLPALQELGYTAFTAQAVVELMSADLAGAAPADALPKYKDIVGKDPQSFDEFVTENIKTFQNPPTGH